MVLKRNKHILNHMGTTDTEVSFTDVVQQATHFMWTCYGQTNCGSSIEARCKAWYFKVGSSKETAL